MRRIIHNIGILLAAALCGVAVLHGCTSVDDLAAGNSENVDYYSEAQSLLSDGQLEAAKEQFSANVTFGQRNIPESYAGLALTELLLLPESDAATELLLVLGAEPSRLPLDIERDLAGPDSFLDRLQRGASDQLVEDAFYRLFPWPQADLESGPAAIFANVPPGTTINELRPSLLALEAELANIEALFSIALTEGLNTYTVPAGTLFSPRDHVFRRSEVHVLIASIKLVRAGIHSTLAYDWPMPLRPVLRGLGGDPMLVSEMAAALNPEFLRGLWPGSAGDPDGLGHLEEARKLAEGSLDFYIRGVQRGLEEEAAGQRGALDWSEMTRAEQDDLLIVLNELVDFVGGDVPVEFQFSEPATSGTLAPFFAGTVLRDDAAEPFWLVEEDMVTGNARLVASDGGLSALFIEPLFEPPFSPEEGFNVCATASISTVVEPAALDRLERELSEDYNY